jgi:hypothetical protein
MKAIVYPQYGSPDVLQFKEVEKPVPGDSKPHVFQALLQALLLGPVISRTGR